MKKTLFRILNAIGRSTRDWRLFAAAFPLVLAVRISLWLLPFQSIHKFLLARSKGGTSDVQLSHPEIYKVCWGVSSAARRVPKASCLTQALVAQYLLLSKGVDAFLRLGVSRNSKGKFDAHAWVEVDGKIVIGENEELSRFIPLPVLETEVQSKAS